MTAYIVVDYSFTHPQDITIMSTFSALDKAMEYCIKQAQLMDFELRPEDIKTHGIKVPGHPFKITRISNQNNLGSNYGVTFNSTHTGNPMAMLIVERDLK